eukprot:GHVN01033581.1.p1 GENE.GHVN01033581.1~~GHVN01033581.1.p1  ORF type:complete len:109 (-),score=8.72 GHVN01033581.1:592-918(-)
MSMQGWEGIGTGRGMGGGLGYHGLESSPHREYRNRMYEQFMRFIYREDEGMIKEMINGCESSAMSDDKRGRERREPMRNFNKRNSRTWETRGTSGTNRALAASYYSTK